MLPRVLEPEVMDTADEARDYDAMDHSEVNRRFADNFFTALPQPTGPILDVGTGTALIPIELCRRNEAIIIDAIDLAQHMLSIAECNIAGSGLSNRIRLHLVDGKRMPFHDGSFAAVVSNSIIHHIPEPLACLAEMHRCCRSGGTIFVRDLLRPQSHAEVERLLATYAAGANDHQRSLFDASLRAALTLDEIRELVALLGYSAQSVTATSDRHWTWVAVKE